MSHRRPIREPLLYYVTDRSALVESPEPARSLLLEKIAAAGRAGVDWIQIREKDLSGGKLAQLVEDAIRRVPESCRILVNDRVDVAMATGANGVHLTERSLPVREAKRLIRERNPAGNFQIGVSTHALEAAREAEQAGADYVFFGPVFATPSKEAYGPPQGTEQLRRVCHHVSIPVIAIGGINLGNTRECMAAGARGIAAIRLFQDAGDLTALVEGLRRA